MRRFNGLNHGHRSKTPGSQDLHPSVLTKWSWVSHLRGCRSKTTQRFRVFLGRQVCSTILHWALGDMVDPSCYWLRPDLNDDLADGHERIIDHVPAEGTVWPPSWSHPCGIRDVFSEFSASSGGSRVLRLAQAESGRCPPAPGDCVLEERPFFRRHGVAQLKGPLGPWLFWVGEAGSDAVGPAAGKETHFV